MRSSLFALLLSLGVVLAQPLEGIFHTVAAITEAGDILLMERVTVRYMPEVVTPPAWNPNFNLSSAIEDKQVMLVGLKRGLREGPPTWVVQLKDGRQMTVDGGTIHFEGTVIGENSLGLTGFISSHMSLNAANRTDLTSIIFLD